MRKWLLWMLSVAVAAGLSATITVWAQVPVQPGQTMQPRVLTGDDIGFRVEGQKQERRTNPRTGRPTTVDLLTGRIVVRVNGQWVEADIEGFTVRPATN